MAVNGFDVVGVFGKVVIAIITFIGLVYGIVSYLSLYKFRVKYVG